MKVERKLLSAAITLALVLTIMTPMMTAFAQEWTANARSSYAYCTMSPNPAGVGQTVYFVGWIYPPPSPSGQLYAEMKFTVTKPDGTKIVRTERSSTEATAGFNYVVDQEGNWTLQLSFPGDLVRLNRLPSESETATLVVTATPAPAPDYTALPDYPWQYPVSAVNREWFRISGAWQKNSGNGYSNYNAYSTGPETSHILWRMQLTQGGLLGGQEGHSSLVRQSSGDRAINPVAAMNMLFYGYMGPLHPDSATGFPSGYTNMGDPGFLNETAEARHICARDLTTGELLWDTILPFTNYTTGEIENDARTSGGSTLQFVVTPTGKGVGAEDYGLGPAGGGDYGALSLWASGQGLWKLDPLSGRVIWYQLEPELSPTYDPVTHYWFIQNWPNNGNLTALKANEDYSDGFPSENIYDIVTGTPPNERVDTGCLAWEVNRSTIWPGETFSMSAVLEGYVIDQDSTGNNTYRLKVLNAFTGKPVALGDFMDIGYASSGSSTGYGSGIYRRFSQDGRIYALSFETGEFVWASDPPMDPPWGTFGTYDTSTGLGLVMQGGYPHYQYCYNATNGKLLWKYDTSTLPDGTPNPYNFEYAQNGPPTWGVQIIAPNAVYWASGEHTPGTPHQRGDALYANAYDGTLLWRLPYFKCNRAFEWSGLACDKMWYMNQYDGMVYFFGKGPTKTTVSVSQGTVVEGGAALIQGYVTDESAGTKEMGVSTRYPNGVPAVSDDRESMDTFMAYLYTVGATGPLVDLNDVKGVTVNLFALGSDGSTVDIGNVQADANGFFTTMWSPPSSDCVYTILAAFAGNKAYHSSFAETAVGVTAAPEATPAPEAPTDYSPTLTGIIAVIAVLAILVAILIVLVLRKR